MNYNKTRILSTNQEVIIVEDQHIEFVSNYIYLDTSLDKENQSTEIQRRIIQTWAAFGNCIT